MFVQNCLANNHPAVRRHAYLFLKQAEAQTNPILHPSELQRWMTRISYPSFLNASLVGERFGAQQRSGMLCLTPLPMLLMGTPNTVQPNKNERGQGCVHAFFCTVSMPGACSSSFVCCFRERLVSNGPAGCPTPSHHFGSHPDVAFLSLSHILKGSPHSRNYFKVIVVFFLQGPLLKLL